MTTSTKPLADRMRPRSLADFVGQHHIVGDGKLLTELIASDQVPSLLLWGPPGSGKTTLARIIAGETKARFEQLSAVTAGVKEVKAVVERAVAGQRLGEKTLLFIDEIHRFNKAQQDALLPHVEDGTLLFIGATTENPSFSVNNALLSRCRTFVLEALEKDDIATIVQRGLSDTQQGLGSLGLTVDAEAEAAVVRLANGDARAALNALDLAASFAMSSEGSAPREGATITAAHIQEAFQKPALLYDRDGEEHYNVISALHKAMRGGDADAALYYLARMLEGGEDPLYIARRIVRFASEDIGIANSFALPQATAAYDACRFIGMPECGVNLAQAVVYMAKSKKNIAVYEGYKAAQQDVREYGNLPVPLHLRNAPTKLMKDLDYGKDYAYTPKATEEENAGQTFLPEELEGRRYI